MSAKLCPPAPLNRGGPTRWMRQYPHAGAATPAALCHAPCPSLCASLWHAARLRQQVTAAKDEFLFRTLLQARQLQEEQRAALQEEECMAAAAGQADRWREQELQTLWAVRASVRGVV